MSLAGWHLRRSTVLQGLDERRSFTVEVHRITDFSDLGEYTVLRTAQISGKLVSFQ